MLAPSARLRGRAVRWARRRPVRSLSATIDTFAFGRVHPRWSGATTIEPPALSVAFEASVDRTGKSRPLPSSSSRSRAAEPVPSAATTTRKPRPISSVSRSVRPVPSPATGPHPDASTSGVSGDSGVESIDQNALVPDSSVSGSAWRRGNERSGSRAHVDARVRARSSSSAIRSRARSRIRRGSTSSSFADGGSTSVSSRPPPACQSSMSHGSQLSMPSKCTPSDKRSHCSRPHGSVATSLAARSRTSRRRHQLAGREDAHLVDVADRSLIVDAERRQSVDLVAPQVDADRGVGSGGVDVDDRAAAGELAAVLDEFLAAVAELDERRRELVGIDLGAGPHDDRVDRRGVGAELLEERPHAGDDHRWHPLGIAEPPQDLEPLAHRLDARADPLERQRLPAGELDDLVGRQELAQVVGELAGHRARRAGDDQRATGGQSGERSDRDRPGHLDDGEARARVTERAGEAGLVAQELGERAERSADLLAGLRVGHCRPVIACH